MDDGGDELDLLGHALGKLLHLLVPPVLDSKADEPLLEFIGRLAGGHAAELGQIHRLVPYLHLAVQATLFRKIADMGHVLVGDGFAVEEDLAGGSDRNAVDDADQGGFPRPVRSQQTEDLPFGNGEGHVVECHLLPEVFGHMLDIDNGHTSILAKY